MNKKIIIGAIALIMIIFAIILLSNSFNANYIPENPEYTALFDFSNEPVTSWNEEKKEYSFNQNISSVNGEEYNTINLKVIFYKDNEKLGSHIYLIDKTENGKFNLNFTKELPEEPDSVYYDVLSFTEVKTILIPSSN